MSDDEHEPPALPHVAQRVLADYRAGHRMARAGFARVERKLVAPPPRRGHIAAIALLAAAITIVVLGAWELARGTVAHQRSDPPQAGDVLAPEATGGTASTRSAPAQLPAAPPRALADAPATDTPSPVAEPQRPRGDLRRVDRGAVPPASSEVEPVTPDVPSSLRAERELLAAAREALTDGALARVLELAARHRVRFPDGVLAPELAAVAAVARCRQSPARAATELAAFTRAHPSSPLLGTVRDACTVPQEK